MYTINISFPRYAPKNITDYELSTFWLYNMVANLWISFGWLPESTRATILQGGFYTLSPRKGFRIIALNSNVCYSYNWYVMREKKKNKRNFFFLLLIPLLMQEIIPLGGYCTNTKTLMDN